MRFGVLMKRLYSGVYLKCCCAVFSLFGAASIYAAEQEGVDWSAIIEQQKEAQSVLREKADALVGQMTQKEKINLYSMSSKEITRLDIPAHDWWNEAIHGVARNGIATQFPVSISMASTWDPELILQMADAIGREARGIHNSRENPTGRYEGLTLWSPTMNLARDPRWGRNEETYGEDPFLTSEMAVSYIRGLQGSDPKYYQAVACAKHFIANNSEEDRYTSAPMISERDLRECYMPAFRAAVVDANVQQVMTAYNGINGIPCTVNRWLLTDVLRNEWGFSGTVVTDAGAPTRLFADHHYVENNAEGMTAMLNAGVDVVADFNENYIRYSIPSVIADGRVSEKMFNRAIVQNLTTRTSGVGPNI